MIHVCSLARLHGTVEETGARHVVTLLRDVQLVQRPAVIVEQNHLLLDMDDIVAPVDGFTAPAAEHVMRLIEFVQRWERTAPMVVHCYAGISRSTAGAFIAACALNPHRSEGAIAEAIRRSSRTAQPNARLVALADHLMDRKGRMIAAVEALGPGHAAIEGDPFRLDLE